MNLLKLAAAAAVAAFVATGAQAGQHVVNGGFETGDFTGWTIDPVSYPIYTTDGANGPVAFGAFSAQIAGYSYGPDTVEQDVRDVSGSTYTLSFWRWQDPALPNGLDVTWNGVSVFSETDNTAGAGFQQFTATVTGSGTDALIFTAYNDPAFTYIDNVSVTGPGSAPEPATWALMIGGFGLAGAALRRRAVSATA